MNSDFINTADNLREITADIVRMASAAGADAAEADASESIGMEVAVRKGKLDDMQINREQGLSLTAYVNGGEGTAVIGELTAAAMRDAVEKALTIARASAPDPCAGLADADMLATDFPDLDLYHPWALSPEKAIQTAKRGEEATWAAHPAVSREKSEGASVHSGATLSAYANSHGFCAAEKTTSHSLSCSAIAEKGKHMESDGWGETRRNADELPAVEDIGKQAAQRAARRLGGKKIGDCRSGVLFLPPASYSLISHFVAAASGGSLFRKTTWLLDKLNTAIFPPFLSIREMPLIAGGLRSGAFDDDGVTTQTRDIVAAGVWRQCFLSAYTARKLGTKSTGNAGGAHNLVVSGDVVPADKLPAMLGDGIIVTHLMGQGVNRVTGDYSRGAAGFLVKNGEIIHPVSEITIAGNLQQMLPAIAAVGDDARPCDSVQCGSVLIPDMTIGGNR